MTIHTIKLSSKEDSQAVKWVCSAMCRNKTKPAILKTIRVDDTNLVACDGNRLHRIETPEVLRKYNQKFLKPLSTIPANPQPVEYEGLQEIIPIGK